MTETYGVYNRLQEISDKNPEKVLISVENQDLTCLEFIAESDRICRALRSSGIQPGMKVAMVLPNSTLWYVIFWGIVKSGAIPVPLDPQAGQWEMSRLFNLADCVFCFAASDYRANQILDNIGNIREEISGIRTIVCTDEKSISDNYLSFSAFLERAVGCKSSTVFTDTLMLASTSGSTGNPKIIAVPHKGFQKSQKDMADYLGFCESDVMLLGMPLYHQGGFGMGLQMVLNGGTVHYQTQFDPEGFLKTIERKRVTVVQLTSTLAKILLSDPAFDKYDLSSVRICYFAGEVLPMAIAQEFFKKRGIRVVNVIGSTETATMVVWDSDYDQDCDVNEFRALAFTDYKLLNDQWEEVSLGESGTIFVHTEALLQEYYSNHKETAAKLSYMDGKKWFNTGDIGTLRANGRVQFIGRSKRIIKRGSNLVCPEENEAFLLTHPLIAAVAVNGEKHELFGEMIVAYVQPKKGCAINRGDIVSFCRGKLAAYKVPDKVIISDSIPHDIGKVQFKYIENISNGER